MEIALVYESLVPAAAGGVEAVAAEDVAATLHLGRRVALQIPADEVHDVRIYALVERIDLADIGGRERLNGAVHHGEGEIAGAQPIGRNGARLRDAAGIAALFVVEEIEKAVALDGAADGAAELIAHQRLAR